MFVIEIIHTYRCKLLCFPVRQARAGIDEAIALNVRYCSHNFICITITDYETTYVRIQNAIDISVSNFMTRLCYEQELI